MTSHAVDSWRDAHPTATRIAGPLGFFRVFYSWGFLGTVILLAINTIACTALSLFKSPLLVGASRSKRAGFLVLHLSVIILLGGTFIGAATRLDGFFLLTEGQQFVEKHDGYVRLAEGPLRPERHSGARMVLQKVRKDYVSGHLVGVTSTFGVTRESGKTVSEDVAINSPLVLGDISVTQDETGFSPRIIIADQSSGKKLFDSFVALRTLNTADGREYRDFLPLSFLGQRVILTLYPSSVIKEGGLREAGEETANPLLVLESQDGAGKTTERKRVALKGEAALGRFTFRFEDLRSWASFKVVDDPGYPVVCLAFCLAIVGLIARYSGDLRSWRKE